MKVLEDYCKCIKIKCDCNTEFFTTIEKNEINCNEINCPICNKLISIDIKENGDIYLNNKLKKEELNIKRFIKH